MTNKYFSPVDFPELEEPTPQAQNSEDPLYNLDLTTIMSQIQKLIVAVESGQSQLIKGAIDLKNAPVKTATVRLGTNPSKEALKTFLETAKQDVNLRFANEARAIFSQNKKLKESIEQIDTEEKERVQRELELDRERKLKEVDER